MKTKLNSLAALLILMTIFTQLSAQTMNSFKVSGRVFDNKRKPLENVDAFLAYTMLSTSTNPQGRFVLKNIPAGTYDLVISIKGYRLRTMPITVNASRSNNFTFRLRPAGRQAPATEVTARDSKDWQNKLKKFNNVFFSTTANSAQCELLNPSAIDFLEDQATAIKAVAQEPLVFENKALGYKITYILQQFEVTVNFSQYNGIPKFDDLIPENDQEQRQWRLNRLKAFNGSPVHFFASLYMNYLKKAKNNAELKSEGFIVSTIMDLRHEADEAYSSPTANRSKYKEIDVNDFITSGSKDSEFKLIFPQYWEVTYTKEPEEEEYLWHQGINPHSRQKYKRVNSGAISGDRGASFSGSPGDQKSLIKLSAESFTLSQTRNYYDMLGLQVYDYWSWQSMADILPREYTIAVAKAEEVELAKEISTQK